MVTLMHPYTFFLLCAAALIVGALIPIQAATNVALSRAIDSVFYASLVLFLVALLVVTMFLLLNRFPLPAVSAFRSAPGYGYLGGLIVAAYVLAITYLAPRIGVGNAICFIVTGQIIMAVTIDHFGLFGSAINHIDLKRGMGVALMIIGLFLARRV